MTKSPPLAQYRIVRHGWVPIAQATIDEINAHWGADADRLMAAARANTLALIGREVA